MWILPKSKNLNMSLIRKALHHKWRESVKLDFFHQYKKRYMIIEGKENNKCVIYNHKLGIIKKYKKNKRNETLPINTPFSFLNFSIVGIWGIDFKIDYHETVHLNHKFYIIKKWLQYLFDIWNTLQFVYMEEDKKWNKKVKGSQFFSNEEELICCYQNNKYKKIWLVFKNNDDQYFFIPPEFNVNKILLFWNYFEHQTALAWLSMYKESDKYQQLFLQWWFLMNKKEYQAFISNSDDILQTIKVNLTLSSLIHLPWNWTSFHFTSTNLSYSLKLLKYLYSYDFSRNYKNWLQEINQFLSAFNNIKKLSFSEKEELEAQLLMNLHLDYNNSRQRYGFESLWNYNKLLTFDKNINVSENSYQVEDENAIFSFSLSSWKVVHSKKDKQYFSLFSYQYNFNLYIKDFKLTHTTKIVWMDMYEIYKSYVLLYPRNKKLVRILKTLDKEKDWHFQTRIIVSMLLNQDVFCNDEISFLNKEYYEDVKYLTTLNKEDYYSIHLMKNINKTVYHFFYLIKIQENGEAYVIWKPLQLLNPIDFLNTFKNHQENHIWWVNEFGVCNDFQYRTILAQNTPYTNKIIFLLEYIIKHIPIKIVLPLIVENPFSWNHKIHFFENLIHNENKTFPIFPIYHSPLDICLESFPPSQYYVENNDLSLYLTKIASSKNKNTLYENYVQKKYNGNILLWWYEYNNSIAIIDEIMACYSPYLIWNFYMQKYHRLKVNHYSSKDSNRLCAICNMKQKNWIIRLYHNDDYF